jgi:hypothetical protein
MVTVSTSKTSVPAPQYGLLKKLLAAVIVSAFLVLLVVLHHNLLTALFPGHNDFLVVWEAARSYWQDGLNPYLEQTTTNIQMRMFGRLATADDLSVLFFAYPMYTVAVLLPLVYMPYAWAAAIWMVALEAMLITALFMICDLIRWRPSPLMLGLLLLMTFGFYFAVRGLLLGQVGVMVYWLEILALWALWKGRDHLAAVALALSTMKPQMGFLLIPLLLIWALANRRWRFLIGFTAASVVLMALSFALEPGWVSDWIAQVALYPSHAVIGSPVAVVTEMALGLGGWAELLVSGVIGLWLLAQWVPLLRGHSERWLWVCALTLAVTHVVAPRTATPHYIVYFLPIVFLLAALVRRRQTLVAVMVALAVVILPWVQFMLTLGESKFEHPSMYIILPFLSLPSLWFTRRGWWEQAAAQKASTP